MIKVSLYSIRKTITLILGSFGVIGIILMITNLFGFRGEWTAGVFPILLINFYQYYVFKKQFFHIDQKTIHWKFPELKEAKSITLESETPEISFNWKGISIKDTNEHYEISLDGLWKKDRAKIQKAMNSTFS